MNNSQDFKTFWWFVLVGLIGYFLFDRYDDLISGNGTYFDLVVFIVWVCLCLAPIFQEIDMFGVKLKQQIKDLKKDIDHRLSVMQTEIQSSIAVSNANSNQIYFNSAEAPPSDSEIPDISDQVQKVLEELGIAPSKPQEREGEDEPLHVEMFKIRYQFEEVLRKSMGLDPDQQRRYSVGKLLYDLRRHEGISKRVLLGSQEVISICNYAVHGEKLTDKQIEFVRSSYLGLLEALRKELINLL